MQVDNGQMGDWRVAALAGTGVAASGLWLSLTNYSFVQSRSGSGPRGCGAALGVWCLEWFGLALILVVCLSVCLSPFCLRSVCLRLVVAPVWLVWSVSSLAGREGENRNGQHVKALRPIRSRCEMMRKV